MFVSPTRQNPTHHRIGDAPCTGAAAGCDVFDIIMRRAGRPGVRLTDAGRAPGFPSPPHLGCGRVFAVYREVAARRVCRRSYRLPPSPAVRLPGIHPQARFTACESASGRP